MVVTGRLDVHTVADVRLLLHAAVDRGSGDLMVHLAEAEVHDATGLGVIVGAHHRARRAGRSSSSSTSHPGWTGCCAPPACTACSPGAGAPGRAPGWVCRLSPPEALPAGGPRGYLRPHG